MAARGGQEASAERLAGVNEAGGGQRATERIRSPDTVLPRPKELTEVLREQVLPKCIFLQPADHTVEFKLKFFPVAAGASRRSPSQEAAWGAPAPGPAAGGYCSGRRMTVKFGATETRLRLAFRASEERAGGGFGATSEDWQMQTHSRGRWEARGRLSVLVRMCILSNKTQPVTFLGSLGDAFPVL